MQEIAARRLTHQGFAAYGAYAEMINPAAPRIGAEPIEFFRDMVQSQLGVKARCSCM